MLLFQLRVRISLFPGLAAALWSEDRPDQRASGSVSGVQGEAGHPILDLIPDLCCPGFLKTCSLCYGRRMRTWCRSVSEAVLLPTCFPARQVCGAWCCLMGLWHRHTDLVMEWSRIYYYATTTTTTITSAVVTANSIITVVIAAAATTTLLEAQKNQSYFGKTSNHIHKTHFK